ncbi:hypothetical protein KA005_85950 [bacterium]|nr:hypothetical protein [bacterium]
MAYIYKIQAYGRYWCLKKKRDEVLVKNIDGQTLFLNEIQRRQEFDRLKNDPVKGHRFKNIIDTIHALNTMISFSGEMKKKAKVQLSRNIFVTESRLKSVKLFFRSLKSAYCDFNQDFEKLPPGDL